VADSGMTKYAMALSLKTLMEKKAFSKISVGDICRHCEMSRKSFYYHFKDKENLVNWIFETELIEFARNNTYESVWEAMDDLVHYFYDNRSFYSKILKYEGQNSFSDYFNELIHTVFFEQLQTIVKNPQVKDFQINFIADGMLCTLKRWLKSEDCIPPEELIEGLQSGARMMANYISQTLGEEFSN
jgi:probable dihydroxyacetone kinase regulator